MRYADAGDASEHDEDSESYMEDEDIDAIQKAEAAVQMVGEALSSASSPSAADRHRCRLGVGVHAPSNGGSGAGVEQKVDDRVVGMDMDMGMEVLGRAHPDSPLNGRGTTEAGDDPLSELLACAAAVQASANLAPDSDGF